MHTKPLRRMLGATTALLLGVGVAIGSGIFRTPGEVAAQFGTPWLIVGAWLCGGGVALMMGLVSAELATRFPRAGGEYVYLREAYGEFAAFFFGWAYTVFIIGGGAATIAAALGDFACELFGLSKTFSGPVAAGAIVLVTGINAIGLRAGAGVQNTLTVLKVGALACVIVVGFLWGTAESSMVVPVASAPAELTKAGVVGAFLAAMLSVLWAYSGATDSVKMAEEIKDHRRALPLALVGSVVVLTLLYVLVNVAMLRVIPADEMGSYAMVPGEAMHRLFGPIGRNTMLLVAMLICLGAISSTILANVRVTYALARDGLTFRFMAGMSDAQAPVAALVVVGAIAAGFALWGDFEQILGIYYFVSAILFGLSYLSLIIFRRREASMPEHVFRCPLGPLLAIVLILVQSAIAINTAVAQPLDILYSSGLLVFLAALYFVWKRAAPSGPSEAFRDD